MEENEERVFFCIFLDFPYRTQECICISDTFFDSSCSLPIKFFFCFFWIANRNSEINCSFCNYFSRKRFSNNIFSNIDKFPNRKSRTSTQIPHIPNTSLIFLCPFECFYMAIDEITNIYIVTNSCTIRRWKIITIDKKFTFFPKTTSKILEERLQ